MKPWKIPPPAKVYEALGAVADGRVKFTGDMTAEVTSSTGEKRYRVRFNEDLSLITSDDNASRWQGYLGYPILAVLMTKGRLDFDGHIASRLAGIPWKEINKRYRNDYDRAVESVLATLQAQGIDTDAIRREAGRVMEQVEGLRLGRLKGS